MTGRAPARGWGAVLAAAAGVAAAPVRGQLGFAVLAIGVIGMAHGASDLAVVPDDRRWSFLLCYLSVAAACLVWWIVAPAVALPLFILASAVHFGIEDAPQATVAERVARGVCLVAAPAVLHRAALGDLLMLAGADPALLVPMVAALALGGVVTATGLMVLGLARRDARLVLGTAALVALPPLVGFSAGFLILHALPQTDERRDMLGCATMAAYLRAVAPVLGLAMAMLAVIAIVVLRIEPSGTRALFAGIAALAIPHLLVTPWFERRGGMASSVGTPAALPV